MHDVEWLPGTVSIGPLTPNKKSSQRSIVVAVRRLSSLHGRDAPELRPVTLERLPPHPRLHRGGADHGEGGGGELRVALIAAAAVHLVGVV